MNRKQIAATIAYTLEWQGFTLEQRLHVGEAFADDLRLKGPARRRFMRDCLRESEKQAIANAEIPGFNFNPITGEYNESEAAR